MGANITLPLSDEDIPAPGRWWEVVRFVQERGDVVYLRDVREHLGVGQPYASRLLAQATLSGKIRNLGHQKGWIATA